MFFSPNKKYISISRQLPKEMERGISYHVEIRVSNHSQTDFSFRIVDGLPQSFERPFQVMGEATKNSATTFFYDTKALIRGDYNINKLYFRYKSQLGLWEKQVTVVSENSVRVIPDLSETKRYLENAQKFLLYEGINIRKQHTGAGDFAKVRSYVVGDDPRMINWRQTAKLHEVMTNEFEPEHGKYITILIDCGRMMGAELNKGNRLEKSLEAALTVAVAALQKGDYVSIVAFSSEVKVFLPPAKGLAHLQTIVRSIYHLQVDAAESNYATVLTFLESVQKRRSFLLLFSDIHSFLHEENALTYLMRLRKRHLFLMVGIEDKILRNRIKLEPTTVQIAMMKSIAQQQMLFKKKEKGKWEKQGLQMIEASEEKLATVSVSYYINLMNRNLL